MPGIYTVKVINDFCGAHRLRGYRGDCVEMHGHNYRLTTEISSSELNKDGMVIDFAVARPMIADIVNQLDHKFFNEIPPFDKINPTAENISAWLYKQISAQLNSEQVKVTCVTLQETPHEFVQYRED